jgi:hypothetical protein
LPGFWPTGGGEYLIPDMVVKFDYFPRAASGKIQKFRLKERIIEKVKYEKKPKKFKTMVR